MTEEVTINEPSESERKNKTEFHYNSRNLMDKVIQYDNSSGKETKNITQYYYDWDGNMRRMYTGLSDEIMIDDLDKERTLGDSVYTKTKYEYEGFYDKLSETTDSLGNTDKYTEYDQDGNLLKMIDRNNSTITYEYDNLYRLKTKSVINSDSSKNVTYSYTYYFDTDKKETVSGKGVDSVFGYDKMGRLESETQANGVKKKYSYWGNSSNIETRKITVNGITKIDTLFKYDDLMRLHTVTENNELEATYNYDENGNRKTLEYSNGNSVIYDYNKANKLETLTNKNGSNLISQYLYEYYLDGNISSKTENVSNKTSLYSYDDLRRLTKESNLTNGNDTGSISYKYNDNSNRETMTVTGSTSYSVVYAYDTANMLREEIKTTGSSKETTDYGYDKNGNQTSKTANGKTTTYTYDGFNRLTGVDSSIKYTYDEGELRTGKSVNGTIITHVWDGSDIVLELDASGGVLNKYVRGINLIYSENGSGTNKKYFVYNGHGDVVHLTGSDGSVAKTYDYDAFGNEVNPDPNDTNHFRYCGEYWDEETGTVYLRVRFYNPGTGRFIAEDPQWDPSNMIYGENPVKINERQDPLGLTIQTYAADINAIRQSGNKYVYAMNNPILFIDPSGIITVVFYYDNPGSGFKDQAMKSPYYDSRSDDVLMIGVTRANDFLREWNKLDDSDITNLFLYLHGGEGNLFFLGSAINFTDSNITFSDLNNKNVKGRTYLYSCHGGQGEEGNNVAWEFAQKTSSKVLANRGGVSYTKASGKYYARTDLKINDSYNITAVWGQYSYNKNGKAKYWPGNPIW